MSFDTLSIWLDTIITKLGIEVDIHNITTDENTAIIGKRITRNALMLSYVYHRILLDTPHYLQLFPHHIQTILQRFNNSNSTNDDNSIIMEDAAIPQQHNSVITISNAYAHAQHPSDYPLPGQCSFFSNFILRKIRDDNTQDDNDEQLQHFRGIFVGPVFIRLADPLRRLAVLWEAPHLLEPGYREKECKYYDKLNRKILTYYNWKFILVHYDKAITR
ncbi:hypothetical protein Pmar_PMAR027019 [Perkinsus marinus ATCC 50983]|uniref:Uncharacterized protein n=1 Tax=Perkinsus marinus (strain ATCC 50983 / TXsc) TaxID=423536 RepID=C5LP32_PERM5|nr:hypothetical protein Pmar_PMAR027019 [Perkinsus marinus ATCC 50983]EER01513.1 hypothetical protein Pmar_PMAR027019 [Perkinsus marinus ATCC 50983]|eukprot:XP_002768795.1 hypothetical protein Pmar_PMAR027019 [Perkinsus marinus ATCC 50983]